MNIKKSILTLLIFLYTTATIFAQCPMCKAAAESNLKEGGTAAMGLNHGILYLLLTPFAIGATLIAVWFYYHRNRKEETVQEIQTVNSNA